MRSVIVVGLVVIVSLAGLPPAAGEDVCLPSCEVPSHTLAFLPPVTFVSSGSTVTWSTIDIVHTATARNGCFHVDFNVNAPASARFFIEDGALFGVSDGETNPCPGALSVADGLFVQDYECLLHPGMRARLVVG